MDKSKIGVNERPMPTTKCPTSRPNKTMDKWIKESENNARVYGPIYDEGDLISRKPSVVYAVSDSTNEIDLKGEFTIEHLEALVSHMKKYNKE
jgi:hypothetical protein